MKKIYQGRTFWVVSGFGQNAKINQVFVAKSFNRHADEEHFSSEFIGTEAVAITKEEIDSAEGLNKAVLMCGGPVRHLHKYSQSIKKVSVLHSFVEDHSGVQYDITRPIMFEVFTERVKAKRSYAKRVKTFIFFDEMHAFSMSS